MAGDINAFICKEDDLELCCFELSVMVAELAFRRKGIAQEACTLMIHYILERIDANASFIAKIGTDNQPSIRLFQEQLGFKEHSRSEVFRLVTYKLANLDAKKLITGRCLRIDTYQE